jgi:hypothetical protein
VEDLLSAFANCCRVSGDKAATSSDHVRAHCGHLTVSTVTLLMNRRARSWLQCGHWMGSRDSGMCGSRRERRAWLQHVKSVHDTRLEMMREAALLSLGDVQGKLHAAAVHANRSMYREGMAKESPLAIPFF